MNELLNVKKEIKHFIRKYSGFSAGTAEIMANYALRTWKPLGDKQPILQFVGGAGTGKTTALQIMKRLCQNPINADEYISWNTVLRLLDGIHPHTLIIDEVPYEESNEDLSAVLDFGVTRGSLYEKRLSEEEGGESIFYDLFGYTVIACTQPISSPAIQNNCITVRLFPKKRFGAPVMGGRDFLLDGALVVTHIRAAVEAM